MSLRRIFRPFLKTVHPDVLPNSGKKVKRTNEVSLQSLNTILDGFQSSVLPNAPKLGSPSLSNTFSQLPKMDQIYDLTFHYRKKKSFPSYVAGEDGDVSRNSEDTTNLDDKNNDTHYKDTERDLNNNEELQTFRTKLMFSASSMSRFVKNIQENQSKPKSKLNVKNSSCSSQTSRLNVDVNSDEEYEVKNKKEDLILSSLPPDILGQFRKLFDGVGLSIPDELTRYSNEQSYGHNSTMERRRLFARKFNRRPCYDDIEYDDDFGDLDFMSGMKNDRINNVFNNSSHRSERPRMKKKRMMTRGDVQNFLIDDLLKRDIYAETKRVKQFIYNDPKNKDKNYNQQQIDKGTINAKVTTLLSKQGKIMQRGLSPAEQLDAFTTLHSILCESYSQINISSSLWAKLIFLFVPRRKIKNEQHQTNNNSKKLDTNQNEEDFTEIKGPVVKYDNNGFLTLMLPHPFNQNQNDSLLRILQQISDDDVALEDSINKMEI